MVVKYCFKAGSMFLILVVFFLSCKNGDKKPVAEKFNYETFKDSISGEKYDTTGDASNIFDAKVFTPGIDSLDKLLINIDTLWHRDAALMEQIDTFIKVLKNEQKYTTEEREIIKENIKMLDSFLLNRNATLHTPCIQKDCLLYAEIIKSTQTLYLYIEGELKDSFKVSTGIRKYETPHLNLKPAGPVIKKYTSRKYPGGNYQGLGNMPYAVFLRGGYAIHGTTPGNFAKLGTKASHGCIRLHPDNAKIFYGLVKRIGLNNTWVTIRDSLP